MEPVVRDDILQVLRSLDPSLSVQAIKELSNHTIHNASIFQDEDSVAVAILLYAMSKITEREGRMPKGVWEGLAQAECQLKSGDEGAYRKTIRSLFTIIQSADHRLRLYIIEVINQAEIKKGTKLYEHGISLAQAASILGVSQWELMGYVGKLHELPSPKGKISMKARFETAKSLFNL
ncbi:MAG: hypothetical protein V1735_05365 [Nanoarchaeota archaeon]